MQAKILAIMMRFIPKNKIVAYLINTILMIGAGAVGYSALEVKKELCKPMESSAVVVDPTPTK